MSAPEHNLAASRASGATAVSGVEDQSAKIRILDIISDQPAHSTYDDVLRELAFYRLVRRGLRSLEGHRFTTDEIRRRVKTWHD